MIDFIYLVLFLVGGYFIFRLFFFAIHYFSDKYSGFDYILDKFSTDTENNIETVYLYRFSVGNIGYEDGFNAAVDQKGIYIEPTKISKLFVNSAAIRIPWSSIKITEDTECFRVDDTVNLTFYDEFKKHVINMKHKVKQNVADNSVTHRHVTL